jgi:hypothetical protein
MNAMMPGRQDFLGFLAFFGFGPGGGSGALRVADACAISPVGGQTLAAVGDDLISVHVRVSATDYDSHYDVGRRIRG